MLCPDTKINKTVSTNYGTNEVGKTFFFFLNSSEKHFQESAEISGGTVLMWLWTHAVIFKKKSSLLLIQCQLRPKDNKHPVLN